MVNEQEASITEATPVAESTPDTPTEHLADEPVGGRSSPAPSSAEEKRRLNDQRWFLLNQLLEATPDHRLNKGEANRKLSAVVRRELDLTPATAERLRQDLAKDHYLQVTREGRSVTYELTDAGREYLQTLDPYPPEPETEPVSDTVRRHQIAHLLLQLFRADEQTLGRGEANRRLGPVDLELNLPAANKLRKKLARDGMIEVIKSSRSESYRLTSAGERLLATLEHYPTTKVTLNGRQLNALLQAVRSSTPSAGATQEFGRGTESRGIPLPADLSQAIYEEFDDLRRERYGHTGLVPIHEIRARIAAEYGTEAARHDVLDEPIRELWRQGRVRMVALSDLGRATPEQLNDSVPGVHETLFYLELAHDSPAR